MALPPNKRLRHDASGGLMAAVVVSERQRWAT